MSRLFEPQLQGSIPLPPVVPSPFFSAGIRAPGAPGAGLRGGTCAESWFLKSLNESSRVES